MTNSPPNSANIPTVAHLVNGALRSTNGRTLEVFNPATGMLTKRVEVADQSLVQEAVAAAQAAFPAWRDTPPIKRARVMFRFKELLEKHSQEICRLIGEEHGKILHDAEGELQRGIENVEFACGAPELLKGEHSKNVGAGIDAWSEFQPLGVVAGITPFNFPAMVPLWMYPAALVCGNCFILKPSERDPSAALFIAQLLKEAGLPDGVMNVVNGDKETVDALLVDERIMAVSFVGSTPIAESIYTRASAAGKRCQALGGAKNHAVIMPDADMDNAVSQLLGAAFGSSGERCMALSVAVAVGDDAGNAFVEKMGQAMASLTVGDASNSKCDFGPLISAPHKTKVLGYIDSAERAGAQVVVDGRTLVVTGFESGYFLGATLIDHVTAAMRCYQEEIFGPVLLVVRVPSLQAAMDLIDAHEYGNGTCIFTRDGEAARYFSDTIKVGMVGINVPLPVPVAYHSFGGWKRSIFGDLHAYGPDAIRFYTKRKTITQRWPSAALREQANFSMPNLE